MSTKPIADQIIDCEESADLVAESQIVSRLDLGHSFLYRLLHPTRGAIAVLNSTCGAGAVLQL